VLLHAVLDPPALLQELILLLLLLHPAVPAADAVVAVVVAGSFGAWCASRCLQQACLRCTRVGVHGQHVSSAAYNGTRLLIERDAWWDDVRMQVLQLIHRVCIVGGVHNPRERCMYLLPAVCLVGF